MSIFKERKRCCEATFLDGEPYWHAYTSGKDTPLLFSLEEDFVFVMNVIAQAAALFPEVRIIAFEVMNNHFHFVVSADEETVLTFWGFVRKRLSDLQNSSGIKLPTCPGNPSRFLSLAMPKRNLWPHIRIASMKPNACRRKC